MKQVGGNGLHDRTPAGAWPPRALRPPHSLLTMADSGPWDTESGKAKGNKKAASEHLARGSCRLPIPPGARLSQLLSENYMAKAAPRPPAPRTCTMQPADPGSLQTQSQVQLLTKDETARLVEAPGGNKEEFLLCLGETYPIPPKALRDLAPPGPGESPTGARPPCQRHR